MTETIIDTAVFSELQETVGPDFVEELLDTFLSEASEMIAELKQARTEENADNFRRAAHSLKSNANVFGAVDLAEAARNMELGGLETGTPDAVETLESKCTLASTAMKDIVNA